MGKPSIQRANGLKRWKNACPKTLLGPDNEMDGFVSQASEAIRGKLEGLETGRMYNRIDHKARIRTTTTKKNNCYYIYEILKTVKGIEKVF